MNKQTLEKSHKYGLEALVRKDFSTAEEFLRTALTIENHSVMSVWSDLGIAIFNQGRRIESLDYFKKAVKIDENYAKGWSNYGNALLECGFYADAVTACFKALQLDGNSLEARTNLGMALLGSGRYREAVKQLIFVAKTAQNDPMAWSNAGNACRDAGMVFRAVYCFRHARHLDPYNPVMLVKLGELLLGFAEHEQSRKLFLKALSAGLNEPATVSAILMSLQYIPSVTQQNIHKTALDWCKQFAIGVPWIGEIRRHSDYKLRIGYVSADFHRHPVGIFLKPLLAEYNRESFSVICYSNSLKEDALTTEFKLNVDCWRVIAGVTDCDAAELIRADGIDILVDLSGHSACNRLSLFSLKPAPVQVSFLGYSHTTGLNTMDYLLSDHDTVLPDEEQWYTEKVVRLSHCRFCYQAPELIPDVEILPALENKCITFGSFNNLSKVTLQVVALWSEVLLAIPDSRLILKWRTLEDGYVRRKLSKLFERFGVASSRIEFRESSPHFLMMAEYGDIDIALDTFPFSGGLTTCEALWMGVPVVTLPGDTPISRQSASFLRLVGLSDHVATSPEAFVRITIKLASDIGTLTRVRECLRDLMSSSLLCNAKDYVAGVESAYLNIWERETKLKNSDREIEKQISETFESASVLFIKNQYEHAEQLYMAILRWKPDHPRALRGLGIIAFKQGNSDKGIEYLKKAIENAPDYADAYESLGNILQQSDRLTDAEQQFIKVHELKPADPSVLTQLGGVYWRQGRIVEAIRYFSKTVEIKPDSSKAIGGLLFSMNYLNDLSAENVVCEHLKWGAVLERSRKVYRYWGNTVDEDRILRVGYLSGDFGRHPVGYFMVKPIWNRNRNSIHVTCYSNRNHDDDMTQYFIELSDNWRNIHDCTDDEVCRMIRNDRIDILVDLAGHTGGNRLAVFARQPAPLQVTWLGYPNTTGLRRIQYRLTDAIADPPAKSDPFYTEQLIRLASGFLCYYPPPDGPQIVTPPFLKNGFITFGSFNNIAKITDEVIAVWSRAMRELPTSRFVMKRSSFRDESTTERFRKLFINNGIDSERVDLLPSTDTLNEHLAVYNSVDIALDSFPYNGTTTTCEAIWMGVPVIVLAGERHAGRVGMSILSRVGLDEFVADDKDDYVAKIINLANSPEKLIQLRSFLRDRMDASPLCNGSGFCLSLENAFREMWKKWCRTKGIFNSQHSVLSNKTSRVRRLHIGGVQRKPGWEIFNICHGDHVDHLGDASDLSRFKSNTFSEIYASHVLEHFDFKLQLQKVLNEWYRVLQSNGTLYISVPDMNIIAELWNNQESVSNTNLNMFLLKIIFGGHGDPTDYHYSGFNDRILTDYLEEAGFVDIVRVDDFKVFKGDNSCSRIKGRSISLNLIAKKVSNSNE